MELKVYGRLTDIVGNKPIDLEGIENTDQLRELLLSRYPDLAGIDFAMAVNSKIERGNHRLEQRDLVSLLPPFSGG
jgi:molybdopterin synthase sulfur carrier subunit